MKHLSRLRSTRILIYTLAAFLLRRHWAHAFRCRRRRRARGEILEGRHRSCPREATLFNADRVARK